MTNQNASTQNRNTDISRNIFFGIDLNKGALKKLPKDKLIEVLLTAGDSFEEKQKALEDAIVAAKAAEAKAETAAKAAKATRPKREAPPLTLKPAKTGSGYMVLYGLLAKPYVFAPHTLCRLYKEQDKVLADLAANFHLGRFKTVEQQEETRAFLATKGFVVAPEVVGMIGEWTKPTKDVEAAADVAGDAGGEAAGEAGEPAAADAPADDQAQAVA